MKRLGFILIFLGLLILFGTFLPVIIAEVSYVFYEQPEEYVVVSKDNSENLIQTPIIPIDEEFGIVIPKLNANAPIIQDVDPYSKQVYQKALTKGVAHAEGTALPNENGSMFLFAHSAQDFYRANQYNAIFYLINRLELEDEIYIFYNGDRYKYSVTDSKRVDSGDVSYITDQSNSNMLKLMTCWPPGTTLTRYIVEAKLVQ